MKIILFLLFFISSITFDNLSIIFTDTNDNKNQNIGSYDERLNPGTTIEFVCQNSSPEQNYNVIIYKNNNTDTLSVYSNTINHKSYWKIDYTLTINDTAYKIYHLNYEKHGKIYMNNKLPDIHDDVSNIDDIYYYNRKLIFSSTQPGNYYIIIYLLFLKEKII